MSPAGCLSFIVGQDMHQTLNSVMEALCARLGGSGSGNYAPSFEVFVCPRVQGRSLRDTVSAALGWNVEVSDEAQVTSERLISAVAECLDYRGDHGAHPSLEFVESQDFGPMREDVLRGCRELVRDAVRVQSFTILEGHPFYPVFWEVAFLIDAESESRVFIGSCSD